MGDQSSNTRRRLENPVTPVVLTLVELKLMWLLLLLLLTFVVPVLVVVPTGGVGPVRLGFPEIEPPVVDVRNNECQRGSSRRR